MNTRIILIVFISLLATSIATAQDGFRKPVKHEDDLKKELFELQPEEHNHVFQAAMEGDNFLIIDFQKMSYWPDDRVLQQMFDIAAATVIHVQDSFGSTATSKRIDVHVPVKNRPLSVRLTEHGSAKDILLINYDNAVPLKLGMDTIRILKTFDVQKDKDGKEMRGEIQYTFVLKEMEDMQGLADDHQLISNIAEAFDGVVQRQRKKWSREDTWYHHLGVRYTQMEIEGDKKLVVDHPAGLFRGLDVNYYIGASLFRNTVTPYLEIGATYKWPGDVGEYDFVGITFSTMPQFERISESDYNFYNTTFIGAEIGTYINRTNTWVPVYETSIGFAYMFTNHPSLVPHKAMKMYFNYSLSPAVRITPDIYVLFRQNQENQVWAGLTLSLKVL